MSQVHEPVFILSMCEEADSHPVRFSLIRVNGVEQISQCFRYEVEVIADIHAMTASNLVGQRACLSSRGLSGVVLRYINGVITSVAIQSVLNQQLYLMIVLQPDLARLENTLHNRAFQGKTVLHIARHVLRENGIAENYLHFRGIKQPPIKPFILQYQESDLHFLNRVFNEFGLFYRFEHDQDGHRLLVYDSVLTVTQKNSRLHYRKPNHLIAEKDFVFQLESEFRPDTGSLTIESYRYSRLNWVLRRPQSANQAHGSQFDLQADVEMSRENLERWSDARDVERRGNDYRVRMLTTNRDLSAGDTFELVFDEADRDSRLLQANYLATHIGGNELDSSQANQHFFIVGLRIDVTQQAVDRNSALKRNSNYHCEFHCIPQNQAHLPKPLHAKPNPPNVMLARVVAPAQADPNTGARSGQAGEVYSDQLGRVLINFVWQNQDQTADACWVRVSTPMAGAARGFQHIPQVGDTVLVSFINGDADTPIIIGSVYTQAGHFPAGLPRNDRCFVIRGTDHDGQANEIKFDDKTDKSFLQIRDRLRQRLRLDEATQSVTLESGTGSRIKLSDRDKKIIISSANAQKIELSDDEEGHAGGIYIQSAAGHVLRLDDEASRIHMQSSKGHSVQLDDHESGLEIKTKNNLRVRLDEKLKCLSLTTTNGLAVVLDDRASKLHLSDANQRVEILLDAKSSQIHIIAHKGDVNVQAPEGDLRLNARRVQIKASDELAMHCSGNIKLDAENKLQLSACDASCVCDAECDIKAQLIKLN